MKNMLKIAMIVALSLVNSMVLGQQTLRWKMKSVETRWKESRLTGASFDYEVKEKKTTVSVVVSKVQRGDERILQFKRSKMRHEKDTDFEAEMGELSFDDKDKLLAALAGVSKKMNAPAKEDIENRVFEMGDITVTYFVEKGKQRLEVEIDDTTFVLQKVDVDQFVRALKNIK